MTVLMFVSTTLACSYYSELGSCGSANGQTHIWTVPLTKICGYVGRDSRYQCQAWRVSLFVHRYFSVQPYGEHSIVLDNAQSFGCLQIFMLVYIRQPRGQ